MHEIILALGGNTGNVPDTFEKAVQLLSERGILSSVNCASLYQSQSLLKDGQDDYINTVCTARTELSAHELLKQLKQVEAELGRGEKHGRWQARSIDMDIIDYDNQVIDTETLKIPHPYMADRSFVLIPLQEIIPDYRHPVTQKSIETMIAGLTDELNIQKLSGSCLTVNNVKLYFKKTACSESAEALILLHGNGEDHHIFDKLVERLAPQFTIYALDSRNHGQSEKTDIYSYEVMAEDLYALITTLKLERVNLLGFSDGAITALITMLKHPHAVKKAALLGLNLKPSDFTAESYAYVKDYYEKTGDPLFKMMLEQPNIELDELENIKSPVFIIAGEHDIYRSDLYEEISTALENSRMLILPGHDHASYIDGQDMLAPYLIDFFK